MNDVSPVVREIRLARERAGWSQEKLAEEMNVSASLVNKVERGIVPASPDYIKAAERVLPPDPGVYRRVHDDSLKRSVLREWFRHYLYLEQHAGYIRWFEPDVVPGLLQVEGYARALLRREAEIVARLERKQIFDREDPPDVIVVVREVILRTRVGTPEVMHDQLTNLVDGPAVVQVLPADTDTYASLDGPLILLTVGDRAYVHAPTAIRGETYDDREVVSRAERAWDAIRGGALPPRQSRDLILKAAETWKTAS